MPGRHRRQSKSVWLSKAGFLEEETPKLSQRINKREDTSGRNKEHKQRPSGEKINVPKVANTGNLRSVGPFLSLRRNVAHFSTCCLALITAPQKRERAMWFGNGIKETFLGEGALKVSSER